MDRIVVVGYQGVGDQSLQKAMRLLALAGWHEAVRRIREDVSVDWYDKKSGGPDALDRITESVELVVALNLCGLRGECRSTELCDNYSRENEALLPLCARLNIPMAAVGQFPLPAPEPVIGVLYICGGEWWPD